MFAVVSILFHVAMILRSTQTRNLRRSLRARLVLVMPRNVRNVRAYLGCGSAIHRRPCL